MLGFTSYGSAQKILTHTELKERMKMMIQSPRILSLFNCKALVAEPSAFNLPIAVQSSGDLTWQQISKSLN